MTEPKLIRSKSSVRRSFGRELKTDTDVATQYSHTGQPHRGLEPLKAPPPRGQLSYSAFTTKAIMHRRLLSEVWHGDGAFCGVQCFVISLHFPSSYHTAVDH